MGIRTTCAHSIIQKRRQYFAPDVDPVQARVLATVQKPIAVSSFLGEEPFGEPAWKALPSWYLVTEQDQMVPADAQHFKPGVHDFPS